MERDLAKAIQERAELKAELDKLSCLTAPVFFGFSSAREELSDCSDGEIERRIAELHVRLARGDDEDAEVDQVIEEQWRAQVEATRALGTFRRALVLSDVSGSMSGTLMEVSIALGILIASLTEPPFQGQVLTFSEEPQFHQVPAGSGVTLLDMVTSVAGMEWGGTTNIEKAFDRILERAVSNAVAAADMPTRLYILSDMQFDDAAGDDRLTHLELTRRKYAAHGYSLPEVIFWNLRSSSTRDLPATFDTPGVACVSGYSPSILKQLLEGAELSPTSVMRSVLDDPRYACILPPPAA